jgi:proline reductase-associated electron transfer protein PrdC
MTYRFMLTQHIGCPSVPCVRAGERVMRGQRLAVKPEGKLGAHIHASVNGEVRAVDDAYIEIDTDEAGPRDIDFECDGKPGLTKSGLFRPSLLRWEGAEDADYVPVAGHTVLERIAEAGVVGAGGAGFPTAAKLAQPLGEGGLLILNAAECEPALCHNIALLEREPERVVCGMTHAMKAVRAESGVIAIKEKHDRAIVALRGVLEASRRIAIHGLPDLYPSGEERALVRELRGVLLRPDQLPREAGCVVLNTETAARIADAVERRKPVMSKDLTLAGQYRAEAFADRRSAALFDVPVGLALDAVIARAGGLSPDCGELIVGGPFTGKPASELSDAPVTKLSGALLAAMPFLPAREKLGLLACACGAGEERLAAIAAGMRGEIAGIEHCKQSLPVSKGARKCENPGVCPGQAEKVLSLYRQGARSLLIGSCSDCTNTVMIVAEKLSLPVYHSTDGVLRVAGEGLVRRRKSR